MIKYVLTEIDDNGVESKVKMFDDWETAWNFQAEYRMKIPNSHMTQLYNESQYKLMKKYIDRRDNGRSTSK